MKLIHGDCLEKMKDIPDKSIDMILCDLPYGTTACKWDVVIPFEPLWAQYKRIIKDRGAIVLFGSEPFSSILVTSNLNWFKYALVWEKDKPSDFALANIKPMCYHENILIFYKNKPTYNKQKEEREGKGTWRYNYDISHEGRLTQDGKPYKGKKEKSNYDVKYKNPKSVLYFDTGRRQHSKHPTQKPVALLEYLIKTYTLENETVLDNCMGSGSTGIACINTNRNFIGIEKDDKYFEIAVDRIAEAREKKALDKQKEL